MTTVPLSLESRLSDPSSWRRQLGLLPVPLYGGLPERAFVLLNGSRGNFCLDLREEIDDETARDEVWSADVGYRLAVRSDRLLVQRWDRPSVKTEAFRVGDVVANFERFHRRLESQAPSSELSVISHALSVFRSLRIASGEDFTGEQSLKAFLALFAAATDNVSRGDVDLDRWGLDLEAASVAASVRDGEWDGLLTMLRRGRQLDSLRPHLPLVLRHASGRLFQEAHYLAAIPRGRQLLIDGFAPDPARILPITSAIGLHFTPSALARALVEEVLEILPRPLPAVISAFDPACGSGEFLRELLRQLGLRSYDGHVRLVGWDISEGACSMSRFALKWEARSAPFALSVEIRHRDALADTDAWPRDITAVLMNPPFKSWRDMGPEMQARVVELLGEGKSGARPDLAMAFLKLAAQSVHETGVVGSVLPASFLDGTSASTLRGEIAEQLHPVLIARLGSQEIFPDARVDPALYVGTRRETNVPPMAFWADHRPTSTSAALRALRRGRSAQAIETVLSIEDGYSLYRNSELGHDSGSWAPRPYQEWKLLNEIGGRDTVAGVFDVRQGVLTGLNRVFILSRETVSALPASEQQFFRPAVLNESFAAGRIASVGFVFYPYEKREIASEVDLRRLVPTFFAAHLEPHRDALLRRKRIDESNWWRLSEHRAWQEPVRPKIVTAYFGDVGAFAWDETGEHVVVQGYAWFPTGKGALPRTAWLAYLALLNSPLMSELLAASSNNVGGGQWNLSKRFVAKMPMVAIARRDFPKNLAFELAQVGEQIHLGSFRWGDAQTQGELRDLALSAFRATVR